MTAQPLWEKLDPARIVEDLWRLVRIPSPTGRERKAALAFAEMLRGAGIHEIEVDESIPDSPCVIGRLNGRRAGKTLQLAGHIDHIDVPHAEPFRTAAVIGGRGSYDMKGGLAGILEIVRVLREGGCDFPGQLLVTVYGLHEEPGGQTRGVLGPMRRGIVGDAAVVLEGPSDSAAIMNNGLARWDVRIRQDAAWCHELAAGPELDGLQETLLRVAEALRGLDAALRAAPNRYPLLRRESVFIGQIHYGDFFNRVPNECSLQGTRRWPPDRALEDIRKEMAALLGGVACPRGVRVEHELTFVGHSYEMKPEEAIVQSLLRGYQAVVGRELAIGRPTGVCDAQRLVREGGVPAVAWGTEADPMHGAHTDEERVDLAKLQKAVRIVLATALDYLDRQASREGSA